MTTQIDLLEKRAKESVHRGEHTVLLFPERNAYLVIDSTPRFSEKFSGKVTSHPVDSGSKVSDHHVTDNPKLQIEGVISDAGFIPYSQRLEQIGANVASKIGAVLGNEEDNAARLSRSKAARSFLQLATAQRFSQVVIVVFSHQSYNNCYITDLTFDRDKDKQSASWFKMSLEQIQTATVTTTTINAVKKTADEKTDADSQPESDGGTKGTSKKSGESQLSALSKSFSEKLKKALTALQGGG